jgi:hypothetical protein
VLRLCFAGWFQCRLATDPDPTDEPRGVSGYTFALAGEPDLDGVIRMQPEGTTPRSHGPAIGVEVRRAERVRNGRRLALPGHALLGARVSLLPTRWAGAPRFVERNQVLALAHDRVIDPFHLEIAGDRVTIRRQAPWDAARPRLRIHDASPELLKRRAAVETTVDAERIRRATGIADALRFRAARRRRLVRNVASERDRPTRAALDKRIRELAIDDPRDRRVFTLRVVQRWSFALDGPAVLRGTARLGAPIDTARPWPIDFWMGAWDTDALCGWVEGVLEIPLR